jgi:hypothetical protein
MRCGAAGLPLIGRTRAPEQARYNTASGRITKTRRHIARRLRAATLPCWPASPSRTSRRIR